MESSADEKLELLERLTSDSSESSWSDEELAALRRLLMESAAARDAIQEDDGLRYAATVALAHAGWSLERILTDAALASRVPRPCRVWSTALVLCLLVGTFGGGLAVVHWESPFRDWLFGRLGLADTTEVGGEATTLASADRPPDEPTSFPGNGEIGGVLEPPATVSVAGGDRKPLQNPASPPPAPTASPTPPDATAKDKQPLAGEAKKPDATDDETPDHPLTLELTKAGFNLLAAVRAALSDGAVADAGRMLIENVPDEELGLLPDPSQPGLWCSYSVCLQRFLQDHPEQAEPTQQHLETVGELRLQAAMREQDVAGVESVTERFPNTAAAAQAYRWLGDRLLAAGDMARAAGCYERMLAWASATDRPQGELRLRLAAAMAGSDFRPRSLGSETQATGGGPLGSETQATVGNGPLEYGGQLVTGPEYEKLVREATQRVQTAGIPSSRILTPEPLEAPRPAVPRLKRWAEVPIGDAVLRSQRERYSDIDWISRAFAGAGTDKLLVVGVQSQITALRRDTGKPQWSHEFSASSSAKTWDGAPFRPLVVGERLFFRRVPKGPPELVCVDLEKRRELWVCDERLFVVSDPRWGADCVYALTLEVETPSGKRTYRKSEPWYRSKRLKTLLVLQLTAFDAESGAIVSQRPLLHFQDLWHSAIPCRVTWVEDGVVATLGGVTFCADLGGRVAWVRKHAWLPPADTPGWLRTLPPAPLVAGRTVIVAQPGVRGVSRLDLDTGRMLWERDVADLRRIVGLSQERLIVQTEHQLLGLRVEDGEIAWSLSAENPLEAFLCGGPGGLLYACSEPLEKQRWRPVLVWVNPPDGKEVARRPLEELTTDERRSASRPPRLGPFLRDGERWLVAYHDGDPRPHSRTLWEIAWGP